jgi:hypothetical protein
MNALVAVCLWVVAAKVIAIFPSRDHHWRSAYVLIAVGVPILVWTVWQQGAVAGVLALAAGAWVLRWPVRYLARWLVRVVGRG